MPEEIYTKAEIDGQGPTFRKKITQAKPGMSLIERTEAFMEQQKNNSITLDPDFRFGTDPDLYEDLKGERPDHFKPKKYTYRQIMEIRETFQCETYCLSNPSLKNSVID